VAQRSESVSQQLAHILVRRQVYLQRYANHIAREIAKLLGKSDDRILERLKTLDDGFTKARATAVLAAIRELTAVAYRNSGELLRKELTALAVAERDFGLAALKAVYPIRVSWTAPTVTALRTVINARPFQGRVLREWSAELARAKVKRVTQAVRIGWVEGQTVPELTKSVKALLDIDARGAQAVARTAVSFVSNAARDELFRSNDDLIKGVRWVSTLDGRTTPICIARDGEEYPVDSGPRPPAHYGCRSTTVPVTKSWEELGMKSADPEKPMARPSITDSRKVANIPKSERDSLIGTVQDQTYAEWLADQSRDFQDDVLGAERAEVFRRGALPIDKFVNDTGTWLNLEQLREREARALRRN
jgi:SPP1 gp7 family putative phage head morphogenesis protein